MYQYEGWLVSREFIELVFIIDYDRMNVDPVPLAIFLSILELDVASLNVFKRNVGAKQ